MKDRKRVIILGVGQLGRRHLQGLALAKRPLDIWISDPDESAVLLALEAWSDVGGSLGPHRLLDTPIGSSFDLAIVASTSRFRLQAMQALERQAKVENWILEKPLAQSTSQLDEILSISGSQAWVNTARRSMTWHKKIAASIHRQISEPLSIRIEGGAWRMASNMLHQVDLARWWSNEEVVEIDVNGLEPNWVPAKRKGYSEIHGEIKMLFSGGSSLVLRCNSEAGPLTHSFSSAQGEGLLCETEGFFHLSSGEKIEGKIELQSQMTGRVVDQIFDHSTCDLPTAKQLGQTERMIIEALLPHRSAHGGDGHTLDIT